MGITFSRHAQERMASRTYLNAETVDRMLEYGAYIPLYQDHRSRRIYKLLYSIQDEEWFVLVQGDSGNVITVLFVDMYMTSRYSFRITDEAMWMAKEMALSCQKGIEKKRTALSRRIRFGLIVEHVDGQKDFFKEVASVERLQDEEVMVSNLLQEAEVVQLIKGAMGKHIKPDWSLTGLIIRMSLRANPIFLSLRALEMMSPVLVRTEA